MTQLERARRGEVTEEMKMAAGAEGLSPEYIRRGVEDGTVIVVKNALRKNIEGLGVGKGLRTKVNANIGTSEDSADISLEIEKLKAAVEAGADAVMDLSTGGDLKEIRRAILDESAVPIGTVPIYQAAVTSRERGKYFVEIDPEDIFEVIERQAEEGVDFMTLHSGVTRAALERIKEEGRIMGVVSRGGALTAEWMRYNKRENPLFEDF